MFYGKIGLVRGEWMPFSISFRKFCFCLFMHSHQVIIVPETNKLFNSISLQNYLFFHIFQLQWRITKQSMPPWPWLKTPHVFWKSQKICFWAIASQMNIWMNAHQTKTSNDELWHVADSSFYKSKKKLIFTASGVRKKVWPMLTIYIWVRYSVSSRYQRRMCIFIAGCFLLI